MMRVCGQMEPNAPPFSALLLTSLAKQGNSKKYDFQLQEKKVVLGANLTFFVELLKRYSRNMIF
jgi:hypothetical protein